MFTPRIAAEIVEHCRSGLFRYNACALVGVGVRTVERWVAQGKDNLAQIEREQDDPEHEGPRTRLDRFGQFVIELETAEAQAEQQVVGVIHKLATVKGDPAVQLRAAQWYLERKNNLRYGRGALRVDLRTGEGGADDGDEDVTDRVMAKLSQIQQRLRPEPEADGDDGGSGPH